MKKLLLALLFVAPPAFACDSLEGAWDLQYAVYKDSATGKVVHEIKAGGEKSLRVMSKDHFSFITLDKDGKFSVAGAGKYSIKAGDYTEVVSYTSSERSAGKTYQFKCRMKDGLWIHSGAEDHLLIEEHWRRAK